MADLLAAGLSLAKVEALVADHLRIDHIRPPLALGDLFASLIPAFQVILSADRVCESAVHQGADFKTKLPVPSPVLSLLVENLRQRARGQIFTPLGHLAYWIVTRVSLE